MAVRIKITPILPKKLFDIPAGQAAKEKALSELGDEAKALFEKTVETWDEKPDFTVNENENNVTVGTRSKIYGYIDRGTAVRYATMIPGFSPKTRVRVIASAQGSGGVIRVDRNHPKPGIKAREFSVIIQERMQKKFQSKFKGVVAKYISGESLDSSVALPITDPLEALPDDERRIVIAWRQARAASKNGTAALIAVKVFSEVLLFIGLPSGKVMLR